MDPQSRTGTRTTAFWAAATLGVPIVLSAALLLTLVLEMSITAADFPHLTARIIAVVVVGTLLVAGCTWGTKKSTDVAAGTAVAAGIVAVIVIVGAVFAL